MEMWVSMEGLVVGFPESSHWKEASLPKPVRTLLTFKSAFARFSVFVEIPAPRAAANTAFASTGPSPRRVSKKSLASSRGARERSPPRRSRRPP